MSAGAQLTIRVLVVDDHPVVRRGLVELLSEAEGISVVAEAAAAVPALELFRRHRPEVVVTDLMLPDMEGPELIHQLLRIDPQARVIVLSSFGSDVDVRKAVEAGALGYLLKDSHDEELILAVRQARQGLPAFSPAAAAPLVRALREEHLTGKELEILQLLVDGLDNREIATRLGTSTSTVKSHISHALQKLGAHDRAQLIVIALRQGLVRVPGKR